MTRDRTFRRYRARHDAVRSVRGLLGPDGRRSASGSPEPRAPSHLTPAAVAEVDAACSPQDAFRAFTDAALYTRWAGVPVTLVDGQFSATMEWGLNVRGTYDLVVPPRLVLMRWDFADDAVPLPGDAQRGYLEITARLDGCRVTVVQLATSDETAHRMQRAWGLMLARFRDHVVDALDVTRPTALRSARRR